jgi:hypothetical protein
MYSCNDTACAVGCPIRISTDQRLLAAPRGFSQRATSFIASWCQGIHRMPFLYSISLPGLDPGITMHRNHPQGIKDSCWKYACFPHPPDKPGDMHMILPGRPPHRSLARSPRDPIPDKSFTAPLNPRRPTVGAPASQMAIPGQTSRLDNGMSTCPEGQIAIARAQRRTRT